MNPIVREKYGEKQIFQKQKSIQFPNHKMSEFPYYGTKWENIGNSQVLLCLTDLELVGTMQAQCLGMCKFP